MCGPGQLEREGQAVLLRFVAFDDEAVAISGAELHAPGVRRLRG